MKSRVFVFVFVFVLAVLAACRAPDASKPSHAVTTEGCAEIDPSFDNLVVTGRWRGQDVPILVDTGANQGSIAESLTAGLAPRPGEVAHFAGASGEFREGKIYDIDGLEIGGSRLAPFRGHTNAIGDISGHKFAIGLEHLAPYIVDFDIDRGWFCLRDQLPGAPALLPMQLARGPSGGKAIMVDATIAGTKIESLIVDTGAGVSTINQDLLPRFPYKKLGAKHESIDGSGVRKREYFVQVPSLCALGTCRQRHVLMPGDDLSLLVGYKQLGIVGVPFFHGHRVIFDFPHQQIAIVPSAPDAN